MKALAANHMSGPNMPHGRRSRGLKIKSDATDRAQTGAVVQLCHGCPWRTLTTLAESHRLARLSYTRNKWGKGRPHTAYLSTTFFP